MSLIFSLTQMHHVRQKYYSGIDHGTKGNLKIKVGTSVFPGELSSGKLRQGWLQVDRGKLWRRTDSKSSGGFNAESHGK